MNYVTKEMDTVFCVRGGEFIGMVCSAWDWAYLCGMEPSPDCRLIIQLHEEWADDGWVDSRTGLDVPPPRSGEHWSCRLRRLFYDEEKGEAIWIAMPVEFLSYRKRG